MLLLKNVKDGRFSVKLFYKFLVLPQISLFPSRCFWNPWCDAPNPAPDGVSGEGVTLRDWDSLTFSFSELTPAFICTIYVITKIHSFTYTLYIPP